MSDPMFEERYLAIQKVLDQAHGTEDSDGSGQGIVEDVYLLMMQRDQARAELAALRRVTQEAEGEG